MFAALNQPIPEALQGGQSGGSPTASGAAAFGATMEPGETGPFGSGRGSRRDGFASDQEDPERRRQIIERMQNMSPEEGEQFTRRFGGSRGGRGQGGQSRPRAGANQPPTVPTVERGARTIDALFGPLPPTISTARVWLYDGHQMNPAAGPAGNHRRLIFGASEWRCRVWHRVGNEREHRKRRSIWRV